MPRVRNNTAEYARQKELAQLRGFSSVREMKTAYAERKEIIEEAGDEPTGRNRHDLVQYYIDYEGMTEEEAVAAMREIWGDSGGTET